ncbi:MAG: NTP transferase domain-containing protein [Candidatus Omnitrophica bacterium]|nr:NTP transferase domain-containing protein [Candidatus Omnitrophota bacterium]
MNIQAVILAGGRGSRLNPVTDNTPKPMIKVCGKPFLEHLLILLQRQKINDILLLVSYLGDKIESHFGDGKKLGLKISYCYEKNQLGTAGALRNAKSKLNDEFILLNGDTITIVDYFKLVESFHKSKKDAMVVAYDNKKKVGPSNITCRNNQVIGCGKNDSNNTHINAGVAVFKRSIVNLIPKKKMCSLEEEIFPQLIENCQFTSFPTSQRFFDMGVPEGLDTVEKYLNNT